MLFVTIVMKIDNTIASVCSFCSITEYADYLIDLISVIFVYGQPSMQFNNIVTSYRSVSKKLRKGCGALI